MDSKNIIMPQKNISNGTYNFVSLKGKDNYAAWAFCLKVHLKDANLENYLETSEPADYQETKANKAKSMLISSISEAELLRIVHCTTAFDIWDYFYKSYGKKTANLKQELIDQLNQLKADSASGVQKVIDEALAIKGKLSSINIVMDDAWLISAITRSLPPSYSSFLENWDLRDEEEQTLNRFLSNLQTKTNLVIKKEEKVAFAAIGTPNKPAQYIGNKTRNFAPFRGNFTQPRYVMNRNYPNQHGRPPSDDQICNYCKKPGHWKGDCRKLQRKTSETQISNKQNVAFMAMLNFKSLDNPSEKWIVDSGCSAHMCPRKDWLINFVPLLEPIPIRLSDNRYIHSTGYGDIQTSIGILRNVYFVEKLGMNLLSVTAATDNGIRFSGDKNSIDFIYQNKVLIRAKRDGSTFTVNLKINKTLDNLALTTEAVWHARLGHLPLELIRKMSTNNAATGIVIDKRLVDDCVDCKLNKCRRNSHQTRTTPKANKPGVSIHFDTIGEIQPESVGGSRYVLMCIDEYSRYVITHSVISKSLIPSTIVELIKLVELQTGNEVIKLTSDQGSEFINNKLRCFLSSKGISHQLSSTYTPQQNGLAERSNQQILKIARTILNSSKLPDTLWAEAIACATYIQNRCINNTQSDTTPYSLWFGRVPNLKNLRIFGQQASVYLNERYRNKLSERGKLMNFVGYTENFQTYRFYDASEKRIVISCDAVFLNKVAPILTSTSIVRESRINLLNEFFDNLDHLDNNLDDTNSSNRDLNHLSGNDVDLVNDSETAQLSITKIDRDNSTSNPIEIYPELRTSDSPIESNDTFLSTIDNSGLNISGESTSEKIAYPNLDIESKNSDSSIEVPNRACNSPTPPDYRSDYIKNLVKNPRPSLARLVKQPINYKNLLQGKDNHALSTQVEKSIPNSFREMLDSPERDLWLEATKEEMNSMVQNDVFELVEPPADVNIVDNKWVFTIKNGENGTVRHKARLVARGFTQRLGIDYTETFAPVAVCSLIRFLFAITATRRLKLKQFDVKTAFLYGNIDTDVFMTQPEGFEDGSNRVCHLKKSLYGLKQAPRMWNQRFKSYLEKLRLKSSNVDECIFYCLKPFTVLAVYVDDGIIMAENEETIDNLVQRLQEEFTINIIKTQKFLGFQYMIKEGNVFLYQEEYLLKVLKKFNMDEANSLPTPICPSQKPQDKEEVLPDSFPFREIVGNLMYAATQTRPDLAFVVGKLSRKVTKPTNLDWQIAKRCLRYIKGTLHAGIRYCDDKTGLVCFSDADYAGDIPSYRSTSGYIITYGGSPILWRSKLQESAATSTTEAEYLAMSAVCKDLTSIRNLGLELGVLREEATKIYCDNRGAVLIAKSEASVQRTRHIGAQLSYIREKHNKEEVDIQHIRADEQLADWLTKPLTSEKFIRNRDKLMCLKTILLCSLALSSLNYISTEPTLDEMVLTRDVLYRPIVWQQTDVIVEVGKRFFELTLTINSPCLPLNKLARSVSRNSSAYNLYREYSDKCDQFQSFEVQPVIDDLTQTIQSLGSSKVKRGADVWSSWLGGFAPPIDRIVSYYNEDSNYNTVWKNEREITNLKHVQKAQHEEVKISIDILQSSLQLLNNTLEMSHDNSQQLTEFKDAMPTLNWAMTAAYSNMREQILRLQNIRKQLVKKRMATEDLFELTKEKNLRNFSPNVTPLLEAIKTNDNTFIFKFITPIRNTNTELYQAFTVKVWDRNLVRGKDIKIGAKYLMYDGPRYAIFNEKANCSKFVEKPTGDTISDDCTTIDTDFINAMEENWYVHETTAETIRVDIRPEIIWTKQYVLIQCFNYRLVLESVASKEKGTYACEHTPRRIPYTMNFVIKELNYSLDNTGLTFNIPLNERSIEPPTYLNPIQLERERQMNTVKNLWTKFLKSKERINKLEIIEDSPQPMKDDLIPYTNMALIGLVILFVLIIIKSRSSPIETIATAMAMSSLAEHRSTSNPNLHVALDTNSLARQSFTDPIGYRDLRKSLRREFKQTPYNSTIRMESECNTDQQNYSEETLDFLTENKLSHVKSTLSLPN